MQEVVWVEVYVRLREGVAVVLDLVSDPLAWIQASSKLTTT
jgi:hypothetical protein